MAQLEFRIKEGRKTVSTRFPHGWRKAVNALLVRYPIRAKIIITFQHSYANFRKTGSIRRGTVQIGNHVWLEKRGTNDLWKASKHVIHIWNYCTYPLKVLLHELAHSYLAEQEEIYGVRNTPPDKRNNETNADRIAAEILYDGVLPHEQRSLTGMSVQEIKEWQNGRKSV